ncbi:MAG: carboxypeptidase-like regulatory domain-containing protein [Candidatus Acidiferrales bacterium]
MKQVVKTDVKAVGGSLVRRRALLWIWVLSLLLIVVALPLGAQDKKDDTGLRTVHGSVIDKSENPVASSVVYLENVKTQGVRTYIADEAGDYRFSGLDPNVDYQIHAEHNDMITAVRTISSFDSRRDIEVTLKLNRKKPPK